MAKKTPTKSITLKVNVKVHKTHHKVVTLKLYDSFEVKLPDGTSVIGVMGKDCLTIDHEIEYSPPKEVVGGRRITKTRHSAYFHF